MSALGQLRRTNAAYAFAGCPLCLQKRTNTRTSRGVRFVPKPDSCAGANSTTQPRSRFRSRDRACISGLLCGAFREQAGRAPFSQTRRNRLPPRVGRESSRSPRSSARAVSPTSRSRRSSLLRRLLSFARSPRRGNSSPWSRCLPLQGRRRSIKLASTAHTTRCIGATWSLAGVHPFGLDYGNGRWARQIGDERLGRFRFLAGGGDACGVDHFTLHVRGERPDDVQARIDEHVESKDRELGVAVGDRLNDLLGCGLCLGLGLHLVGDAEPLVYASKLSAGGARRYRSDGLRLE